MIKSAVQSEFRALGTDIFAKVILDSEKYDEKAKRDLHEAEEIYSKKQKVFCRFSPESELSRLNRNLGTYCRASKDILYLAKRALFYFRKSNGLYDPRIIGILEEIGYGKNFRTTDFSKMELPQKFGKIKKDLGEELKIKGGNIYFGRRMDFSGIAKGYITDCAAKCLQSRGWKNFLVDSGGDMFAAGTNERGEKWKISVEGIPEEKLALKISEKGIATSGISRKKWQIKGKRFHHLVNPKNPSEFSFELQTVTVIEKNTENADGRAKVLVLLGKDRGMKFAKKNKIAAIFLDYKGNIFISPEAKKYTR